MRLPGYNSLKHSHRLLAVLSAPSISETSLHCPSFQLQILHPSGSLMYLTWRQCPSTRERQTKPMKWNCFVKKLLQTFFWWSISIPLGVTETLQYILLRKWRLLFSLGLQWNNTWSPISKRWDCISGTAVQFMKGNYTQRRKKPPNSLTVTSARLCSRISEPKPVVSPYLKTSQYKARIYCEYFFLKTRFSIWSSFENVWLVIYLPL